MEKRIDRKIIAITNHKGGVGKTTTACNVGGILADKGYKVLLIDLDCQANLTSCLYGEETETMPETTIYEIMTGERPFTSVKIKENLSLVPSSLSLAMADIKLSQVMGRELLLREAIEKSDIDADFIILDCPPSLTLLTQNAMAACTDVIVPVTPEVLPTQGLKTICDFIEMARKRLNGNIKLTGIAITRYERNTMANAIENQLRAMFQNKVYKQKIRKNVRVASSPLEKKCITEYDKKSHGAEDYLKLTEEILKGFNQTSEEEK